MHPTTRRAFTLVELLVIITTLAVLIAMLLPALTQARESAWSVICKSNLKQMVMAAILYTTDNEQSLPPSVDTKGKSWAGYLLPWLENENVYECGSNLGGYTGNNMYEANGYFLGFADLTLPGVTPTTMREIRTPARWMMMGENTEDWERANRGEPPGTHPTTGNAGLLTGGYSMCSFYFRSAINPGEIHNGGRHFRGGGRQWAGINPSHDPWGFENISFGDGHVQAESMESLVRMAVPNLGFYEFPFRGATPQGWVPPFRGPQPGAEWWRHPDW